MKGQLPESYMMVSGIGKGKYPLLAFDNALQDAGIMDYNLVKISSVLPVGCQEKSNIDIQYGSIIYTAYSTAIVENGQDRSLAVALAVPLIDTESGVIFEFASDSKNVETEVIDMCKKAMNNRNRDIKEIKSTSVHIRGEKDYYVCGLTAVVMW